MLGFKVYHSDQENSITVFNHNSTENNTTKTNAVTIMIVSVDQMLGGLHRLIFFWGGM